METSDSGISLVQCSPSVFAQSHALLRGGGSMPALLARCSAVIQLQIERETSPCSQTSLPSLVMNTLRPLQTWCNFATRVFGITIHLPACTSASDQYVACTSDGMPLLVLLFNLENKQHSLARVSLSISARTDQPYSISHEACLTLTSMATACVRRSPPSAPGDLARPRETFEIVVVCWYGGMLGLVKGRFGNWRRFPDIARPRETAVATTPPFLMLAPPARTPPPPPPASRATVSLRLSTSAVASDE